MIGLVADANVVSRTRKSNWQLISVIMMLLAEIRETRVDKSTRTSCAGSSIADHHTSDKVGVRCD